MSQQDIYLELYNIMSKNNYDVDKSLKMLLNSKKSTIEKLNINIDELEKYAKNIAEIFYNLPEIQEKYENEKIIEYLSKYLNEEDLESIKNILNSNTEIDTGLKEIEKTDIGNSIRFANYYAGDILYSIEHDKFYKWDGKRWKQTSITEIEYLATEMINKRIEELKQYLSMINSLELKKEIEDNIKWYLKSSSGERIKKMVRLARGNPLISINFSIFDKNPYHINTPTGIVDLRTLEVIENKKEMYITRITNVGYNKNAKCENWKSFLKDIFISDSLIDFIQKALGYSITGDTTENVLFLMYGIGANGKTTFLNTIKYILGDYAKTTSFDTFIVNKNHIRNDIARLHGARFIIASESEEGQRIAEALVKQFTGGDFITARFLYHEFFEFKPEGKIWLSTNHKPDISGVDYGIWRRILLIPFTVVIPPEKQIKNFYQKYLLPEAEGILNWIIEGAHRWIHEGLKPPDEVKVATEEYKYEMDILQQFLEDMCEINEEKYVSNKDLYKSYEGWCKVNGLKPLSHKKFTLMLKDKGFSQLRQGKERTRLWKGLTLKENQELEF